MSIFRAPKWLRKQSSTESEDISKVNDKFVATLEQLMDSNNISFEQLAKRLKVSKEYTSSVLLSDAELSVRRMVSIARAFDSEIEIKILKKRT